MPKIIIGDFSKGLWAKERNLPVGFMYSGVGANIYRYPGFLTSNDGLNDATPLDLDGLITEQVADNVNNNDYLFSLTSNKIFKIKNTNSIPVPDTAFHSAVDYIAGGWGTSAIAVRGMIANLNGVSSLLWGYQKSDNSSGLGSSPLTGTFTITDPAVTGAISAGFADMLDWHSFIWLGCGRYIDKVDPTALTNSAQAFDLGIGWIVDCLVSTPTYLGIFCHKIGADSRFVEWDGVSSNEIRSIPLRGITSVVGARNIGGVIRFIANAGSYEQANCVLTNNGYTVSENTRIKMDIAGALKFPQIEGNASLHVFNNKLLMGTDCGLALCTDGNIMSNMITGAHITQGSNSITSIKSLPVIAGSSISRLGVGGYDSVQGNYFKYIDILIGSVGVTSIANYKSGYIDFGANVRVNYIKFCCKPLVAGDSLTPTLNLNYDDTTVYIMKDPKDNADLSFTNDGAVNAKRYNIGVICDNLRVVLDWPVNSKVAIAEITIDFSPIPDNY